FDLQFRDPDEITTRKQFFQLIPNIDGVVEIYNALSNCSKCYQRGFL
ncbi:hypothetical protein A2U01_0079769, partial [Trifolium medium]|nr:hypothetical protein [Trifolium medium]